MTDSGIAIYRAWDGDELLYVGLTINPSARFSDHSHASDWWPRAGRIEIERLPADVTRPAALAIEAEAIRNERPRFNIMCNSDNPNRRIRMPGGSPHRGVPMTPEFREKLLACQAERISTRSEVARLDAQLPSLVYKAFDEGFTAAQIAPLLGVTPARVYQIRDGRR